MDSVRPFLLQMFQKTIICGICLLTLLACELQEEKITTSSSVNLLFSTDTVLFDTLLTAKSSITKRFRIYNPDKNAISISSIRLAGGASSPYDLVINGRESKDLTDEVLFGGDSLMVLVSVTIDPQDENLPYLVKDSVLVSWNNRQVDIKLVAWGQDAVFLNQEVICSQTWTAERPYVIYNYVIVDSLCVLTVEPGARIYLENQAVLLVGGTLKVLGDSANRVTFRNTRFDANYRVAPGQWGGIQFGRYSKDNEIRYADIENGDTGIYIGSPDEDDAPDLVLSHTRIAHMATAGIIGFSSDLHVYNTLVYDCGLYVVGNFAGGTYSYEHCTFTNWPGLLQSDEPGVVFTNFVETTDGQTLIGDLNVSMHNTIIWGSNDEELYFDLSEAAGYTFDISSNIIRSKSVLSRNVTSVKDNFPGFEDPFDFDFSLDSLANARDVGIRSSILDDILGIARDTLPDIGAYERLDRN